MDRAVLIRWDLQHSETMATKKRRAPNLPDDLLPHNNLKVLPNDDQAYPEYYHVIEGPVPDELFKYRPRACSRKGGTWPVVAFKHPPDWGFFRSSTRQVVFGDGYIYMKANADFALIFAEYITQFKVFPQVEVRTPSPDTRLKIGDTGPVLIFEPSLQPAIIWKNTALKRSVAKKARAS